MKDFRWFCGHVRDRQVLFVVKRKVMNGEVDGDDLIVVLLLGRGQARQCWGQLSATHSSVTRGVHCHLPERKERNT